MSSVAPHSLTPPERESSTSRMPLEAPSPTLSVLTQAPSVYTPFLSVTACEAVAAWPERRRLTPPEWLTCLSAPQPSPASHARGRAPFTSSKPALRRRLGPGVVSGRAVRPPATRELAAAAIPGAAKVEIEIAATASHRARGTLVAGEISNKEKG